jgi:hypothetical protein
MTMVRIRCPISEAPSPGVLYETEIGPGIVRSVLDIGQDRVEIAVELPEDQSEGPHHRPG